MRVRNIVRKAAALGAGAATVGMTLAGAFAYDLSTYPQSKFIVDGKFDGEIVIGKNAATSDVIGAIDIAASLQGASVTKVPLPGAAGEVTLSGENFKLESGSDKVELREPIGEVTDTITESNLPGLKSGRITTSEGDTDYFQYLRFKDGANLQNMTVNYVENDDDVMSDYFVVDTDSAFMEWEIQFPEGLESELDDNNQLEDIEDRSFNILGTDFTIVKAEVYSGNINFEVTLMGGSIADTLREGETRTYSIDGVDYEVTLVFVSDPNSGDSDPEAKFSVNGELTQALVEGDTDTLSGGLQIGVRDVLVNSREGVASFFLGADKVVFSDSVTNETDFNSNVGDVEINNENINDGDVQVSGTFIDADSYEITSIKYRLTMDADKGTTAYIPPGQGVKAQMRRPESLISESLDVTYQGLTTPERTEISIDPKSDDEYRMTFTNIQGQEYSFPLLSNKDGAWKFGEGDSTDDDLIFVEAGSLARYNIGREDYFIVSNDRGVGDADKSVTNVLRYEDYDDTDRTLELQNVASGSTVNVPIDPSGLGSLVIGGHTYRVNVSNVSAEEPTLSVDLDASGDYNDVVKITTWGGVIIDLLYNAEINSSVNISSSSTVGIAGINDLGNFTGNGESLEIGTSGTAQFVTMQAKVLSKNFDSSDTNTDETFTWNLQEIASGTGEVDLDFSEANYAGPLENSAGGDPTEFQFNELDSDDETDMGMTDYGILIEEKDPDGSDEPNTLTLSVPETQVFAQLFVTLGTTETLAGAGSGMSDVINPIAVGLAVLDEDAGTLGSVNQIIVGGPCANTAAAAFLGNPENCAEGFEAGKAMIVAKEYGDKVAILVAGYEAMETQGASRVLAAYKDYSLKGTEAEVVVASLNDISVKASS